MDKYALYKARLGASSASESLVNSTLYFLQKTFSDSPTYRLVTVNGQCNVGIRIQTTDKSHICDILMMPDSGIKKGDILTIDSDYWLVTDVNSRFGVFNIGTINQCNEMLKWKDGSNTIFQHPCVVKSYSLSNFKTEYGNVTSNIVEISVGKLNAHVSYNEETKAIYIGQRFIIGNNVYKVAGIDDMSDVYNGHGFIKLTIEITEKRATDDFVNKIADNGSGNSSGGDDTLW